MVKLAHHPSREEMKRLRERWDREDEDDIPLKAFDTTLTNIDDTVRHLRVLRQDKHSQGEAARASDNVVERLTAECKALREALDGIITTLNHKASKRVLGESLEKCAAAIDKRIDNIFKLVGGLGVIFGILIAIKSH